MFVCPVCEVENRLDAKFCRKCGQSRTALEQYVAAAVSTPSGKMKSEPSSNSQASAHGRTAMPVKPEPAAPPAQAVALHPTVQRSDSAVSQAEPSRSQAEVGGAATTSLPDNNGARQRQVSSNSSRADGSADLDSSAQPLAKESRAASDISAPECPACWTVLRATDQYCCWCGEPQPSRALPLMKMCLECNTKLPEKANFCFDCGHNVSDRVTQKVRFPLELFHEEESEFFPRFDA
ncbi:MAG TPA: zinc ribbon domain-containing protein [Planktothrix sp.]